MNLPRASVPESKKDFLLQPIIYVKDIPNDIAYIINNDFVPYKNQINLTVN